MLQSGLKDAAVAPTSAGQMKVGDLRPFHAGPYVVLRPPHFGFLVSKANNAQ